MSARLGLGLAALGRPGYVTLNHATDLGGRYDPAAMEAHAHEVLDAAFDAGLRYVDAARSYGRAEEFVASWLRKRSTAPGEIMVASKWGYTYTAHTRRTVGLTEARLRARRNLRHHAQDHGPPADGDPTKSSAALDDIFLQYKINDMTVEIGRLLAAR